jgi:hypothetical protein
MKTETTTCENKGYKVHIGVDKGNDELVLLINKQTKLIKDVEKRLLRLMLYYYISLTALIFIFTR